MSNFTTLHLTHEIFTILTVFSVKFDIHFLGQLNNLIRERREALRGTHPPVNIGKLKDI